MTEDVRKELVSYYKWVVSLEIFVITVTISLVSAIESIHITTVNKVGLMLLAVSILVNWVLIKRLVTMPIVEGTSVERKEVIHKLFEEGVGHVKWYGLIQNLTFIIGVLLIFSSIFCQL